MTTSLNHNSLSAPKNLSLTKLKKSQQSPHEPSCSKSIYPAKSQKLIGTVTNLESTNDRMISYRHQRHLWVTSDGAIHLLFNQGANYYGASLVLYSSFDSGKSWKWILSIPNNDSTSTANGFLYNQKIFITYSSTTGSLLFLPITYDTLARK